MKKLRQLKNVIKGKNSETKRNVAADNCGYVIDSKDNADDKFTKLHQCCWAGDEAKVRKYVKRFDVNCKDGRNRTPIHLAVAQGYKDIVMVLLENKADVEVKDCDGQTPLMKVAECGHADLVGILIGYGANINVSDNNMNTSLHVALEKQNIDIALALLHHKAAVDLKNKDGNTPLHIATAMKQPNVAKVILQKGAVVDVGNKEFQTPLILACKLGSFPLASLLIEHRADPLFKDKKELSAIDYCNMSGDSEITKLFINVTAKEQENLETLNDKESSNNEVENAELDIDIDDSFNDSEMTDSSKKLPIAARLLFPDEYPEETQNFVKRNEENEYAQDNDVGIPDKLSDLDDVVKNKKEGNESPEAPVLRSNSKVSSVLPYSIEKINKKKEDLFADLGFSDSVASDESNSIESSDDRKPENKKMLPNSIEGQPINEKQSCSPAELPNTDVKFSPDSSKSEANYEPYIPSVTTRRRSSYIPEVCAAKRHPLLSERTTSLDISYSNEDASIHCTSLSKDNFATGTEALEHHGGAVPTDAGDRVVSDNTNKKKSFMTDSESDWDSDSSENVEENKNEDCHVVESQKAIPLSPKQELCSEDASKEHTAGQDLSLHIRTDDGAVSQNNSEFKVNPSFCEEGNNHSEEWSTLGRPGTLQGSDEIWENNPGIEKSSKDKSSENISKQNFPIVKSKVLLADEDSSTTVTDTEEDRIQKKQEVTSSDLNDAPDDTLSISTDEELFQDDGCNNNNALLHHTLSPSELVTLQATVREQRLAVNKKNDKINSLKRYQKTLQQEKAHLREKLRKAVSNSGLLKNTILDLKNQLSCAEYSLQEEKQNRENVEALLKSIREKVSHKNNLYINENKLRKSLESMLQSEKDDHNSANEIINVLQAKLDKLKLELEQQKMLSYSYKNRNSPTEVTEKATNVNMLQTKEDDLQLELERMKTLVQDYESRCSVETADKSTSAIMVDLDDKISKQSEEIEHLRNENQGLTVQLQLKNGELQIKQHELNAVEEKHNYELKNIEAAKEDLERKAKLETENERLLRKEVEEMAEKMKNLNVECEQYRQSINALHKAVTICQTSEEVQNTFSSHLEKLKLENMDLKVHLNEIRELHSHTKNVVVQGREEALDILSSINRQLETTLIELEEKSRKVSSLENEVKQKQQYCFEKDVMIEKLEQENNMLKAKSEMLRERLSECEKKENILQTKLIEVYKTSEVQVENYNEKEDSVPKEVDTLKIEKINLEKELMKEQQYSATLGTTLDMYKQNENTLHTQIQAFQTENQQLKDKLCQEKEHSCALHFKLNAFNEIEEALSQKIKAIEREKLQLENEIQKGRDHSDVLDSKQGIFSQNLKKMEELISNLQTAKEEIERKRTSGNNELSDVKAYCSNCPPFEMDSIMHLTEKLKDMEHLKNEKEALIVKEKRKALKALKSKRTADSQLQKEKQRIHQLMDVISDLKLELETANKKIKDLENSTQVPDQRQEQDDWKSRTDELNAQIDEFRQQAEKEYNQRKEIEATCSLMKTELSSLRTVQTTLIEELLNELKSVKSQNQEQAALTYQMESWHNKKAENANNEAIYNALKDISFQLKLRDSTTNNKAKVSFTETKQKLMDELAQLRSTMKHKEYEYEILEEQRNRLHRSHETQKPQEENPPYLEEGVEIPIKLSSEDRLHNTFSDSIVTSQRWSTSPSFINSAKQFQEALPQPISPIRNAQHLPTKNSSMQDDDNSNRLLPEIQIKLDDAIAKHLNSAPRVDFSTASHHSTNDNSTSSYMSSLQKRYFV